MEVICYRNSPICVSMWMLSWLNRLTYGHEKNKKNKNKNKKQRRQKKKKKKKEKKKLSEKRKSSFLHWPNSLSWSASMKLYHLSIKFKKWVLTLAGQLFLAVPWCFMSLMFRTHPLHALYNSFVPEDKEVTFQTFKLISIVWIIQIFPLSKCCMHSFWKETYISLQINVTTTL